jgi:long-chain acyl-CoA synthetase
VNPKIEPVLANPEDPADIVFTTGTTGDPKGVVLSHKNILCAANNINTFIGNTSEDREVVPLPLSHSFGLGRLRCNLLKGGTIILEDGITFPAKIFKAIEKWEATGFSSVPAGLAMLLRMTNDRIGRYAEQMRYLEIGSSPMPIEDKRRLMKLLPNTRICMHYGLTEASRSSFIEFHESSGYLDSVGRATPNVEIKIVDENNVELPPRHSGRIMVRGGMVLTEYWGDPEATKEAFKCGWLYTGDYGYLDQEGYLYLESREKELINVGGRKVSPIEIEKLLVKHPCIQACGCVGILDPRGITGEAVKAFLVSDDSNGSLPDESDLVDFLFGKLEPYKMPVEYEWIDSLPMTASGKIQRISLKENTKSSIV